MKKKLNNKIKQILVIKILFYIINNHIPFAEKYWPPIYEEEIIKSKNSSDNYDEFTVRWQKNYLTK